MNKIFTLHDKAKEEGHETAEQRTLALTKKLGIIIQQGKAPPVWAYVDHGRWLAPCECGGLEYVAPGVPFMCYSCGNSRDSFRLREVLFPEENEREAIEAELLNRDVFEGAGIQPSQRIMHSKPKYGAASRSWWQGETVQDLKDQLENEKEKTK